MKGSEITWSTEFAEIRIPAYWNVSWAVCV